MAIEKITVIGNREISRAIVDALISSSSSNGIFPYQICVLTYPSQAPDLPRGLPSNIIQHKTSDFSSTSLEAIFSGQDLIISTVADRDHELQICMIDAIVAAGAKRFVPCEFGQDSLNEAIQKRVPRYADHAKVIEYLRQTSKTHGDFEWTALATGCTLDSVLVTGELGFDFQWQSATVHGNGTEIFAVSSLERVGKAVCGIVWRWNHVKNQFLYAAGTLTSTNDILVHLENLTASKWSVGYSDVDECIREGESRIKRGFPDAGIFLLERSVLYDQCLGAAGPFQNRSANEHLQLQPETVESIVTKAYRDFRHRGKPSCGCT